MMNVAKKQLLLCTVFFPIQNLTKFMVLIIFLP